MKNEITKEIMKYLRWKEFKRKEEFDDGERVRELEMHRRIEIFIRSGKENLTLKKLESIK